VSSKAIIAILSKTRPIARTVLLPVCLFVRPMLLSATRLSYVRSPRKQPGLRKLYPPADGDRHARDSKPPGVEGLKAMVESLKTEFDLPVPLGTSIPLLKDCPVAINADILRA